MNPELYKTEIDKIQKVAAIDDGVLILTDSGSFTIKDFHYQDCCELVYADWSTVDLYRSQLEGLDAESLVIKGVEDAGFLLSFEEKWSRSIKVFIPCYNSQNGYYSSNLELIVEKDGIKTTVDISSFVEDNID